MCYPITHIADNKWYRAEWNILLGSVRSFVVFKGWRSQRDAIKTRIATPG